MPDINDEITDLRIDAGRLDERLIKVEKYTETMNGKLLVIHQELEEMKKIMITLQTENAIRTHIDSMKRWAIPIAITGVLQVVGLAILIIGLKTGQ